MVYQWLYFLWVLLNKKVKHDMECGENDAGKMVATLQSRKDALEAKLKEKTGELKKLCIQEAELTGVLPPEIPLQPGESPPVFRRRMGTAFAYPENLINNKLKSKEEESVAKLELECKIQMSIAEAALGLANDENANKTIRRKHRLMYQQSQKRLTELEAKLSLLRQNIRGSQLKQQQHRKKPRPPLQMENESVDGVVSSLRETANGTCVKNSSCQTDRVVVDNGSSSSFPNRNLRIVSGASYNSFGKSYNTASPPAISTLPAAYMRQNNNNSHYNHHHHHHQIPVNNNRNHHDWNSSYRLSSPPPTANREPMLHHNHHHSTIGLCVRENRNWVDDSIVLVDNSNAGTCYYSNNFYEITTGGGNIDEKIANNNRMKSRYGSLDRRRMINSHTTNNNYEYDYQQQQQYPLQQFRHSRHQYSPSQRPSPQYIVDSQSGSTPPFSAASSPQHVIVFPSAANFQHGDVNGNTTTTTTTSDGISNSSSRSIQNVILLPNQTYPENSLMRTQSLGNVEQQQHHTTLQNKPADTFSLGAGSGVTVNGNFRENAFQSGTLGRKSKEKEWRETSLDYNVPNNNNNNNNNNNVRHNTPPLLHPRGNRICAPTLPRVSPTTSLSSSSPRYLPTAASTPPPPLPPSLLPTIDKSCGVLEDTTVIVDNTRSPVKSPILVDTGVPFESPKNHTVVEVGKWQPYREVTKPFEMSDFYKYSTKFRKNHNSNNNSNNNSSHNSNNSDTSEHNNVVVNRDELHNFPEKKVYITNRV